MFSKLGVAAYVPFSLADSLQAAGALLICSAGFGFYTLSRLLAASAAEAALHEVLRWASNPVEALTLAIFALWLLKYSTGYGRVLQLLTANQLKIIVETAVAYNFTLSAFLYPVESAASRQISSGKSCSDNCSSWSSSHKEVRPTVAEHPGRSLKHKHRWSFDVAPSSGPREDALVPKQRAPSVDPLASSSPAKRHSSRGTAHLQQVVASSGAATAKAQPRSVTLEIADAARSVSRTCIRKPLLQRTASGQERGEVCHSAQHFVDNTRAPTASTAEQLADTLPPSSLMLCSANTLAVEAAISHPLQRFSTADEATLSDPATAQSMGVEDASAAANTPPAGAVQLSHDPGQQPGSTSKASAATVRSWVYSRAVVPVASWASSTVEFVVRPLLSGGQATERLHRTQSAPARSSATDAGMQDTSATAGLLVLPREDGTRSRMHPGTCRRVSLDIGGHSYMHGGIAADLLRTERLEEYARAARLEAYSPTSSDSHPVASSQLCPTSQCQAPQGSISLEPLGLGARRSAVASVGLDGDCAQEVRELVTDEHLVQFGAVLGEGAALKVSAELSIPPPWGSPASLFGVQGSEGSAFAADMAWEQILEESKAGLQFSAWRKPLRGGLYLYRSSAVFAGVEPAGLRAFQLNDGIRPRWDDTVLEIERVAQAGVLQLDHGSECCLHRFRSRFPRPMAARLYKYARRVWHRQADGGCYIICRTANLPSGNSSARAVEVTDFVSCTIIRTAEGGAELVTVYFEDSQVRPGLAKMAVPKGLWPFIQKYETALRSFLELTEAPRKHVRHHAVSPTGVPARVVGDEACGTHRPSSPAAASEGTRRMRAGWRLLRRGRMQPMASRLRGVAEPSHSKLLRNVVLATGITVLYDLMRR